jgi:hypothetical protein
MQADRTKNENLMEVLLPEGGLDLNTPNGTKCEIGFFWTTNK